VCFAYGKKRQNIVRGRGTQTSSTATVATNAGVGVLWWWWWSSPATATSAATTAATRPRTEKGSHRHHRQANGTIQALVGRESVPSSPGGRWRCGRRGSDHRRSIHLVPPMIIIHTDDVNSFHHHQLSSSSATCATAARRRSATIGPTASQPIECVYHPADITASHTLSSPSIDQHTVQQKQHRERQCIGGRVAASAGLSRRQLFMISSQDTRKRVLSNIPVPSGRTKEFCPQFFL
jgi:hypothetical protein